MPSCFMADVAKYAKYRRKSEEIKMTYDWLLQIWYADFPTWCSKFVAKIRDHQIIDRDTPLAMRTNR